MNIEDVSFEFVFKEVEMLHHVRVQLKVREMIVDPEQQDPRHLNVLRVRDKDRKGFIKL